MPLACGGVNGRCMCKPPWLVAVRTTEDDIEPRINVLGAYCLRADADAAVADADDDLDADDEVLTLVERFDVEPFSDFSAK